MTNYEQIKSMNKDDMARFIDSFHPNCNDYCKDFKCGCSFECKHNGGYDIIKEWLDKDIGFVGKI